jgi:hypothetical protein
MNELFKTLRLAFYVCALPLIATAMVSAHAFVNSRVDDEPLALEAIDGVPAELGTLVSDVSPNISHVLRIDSGGGVSGRILVRNQDQLFGARGMEVSLNFAGNTAAIATSGDDGVFRFENVRGGAYTLIASAPGNIVTFGVYVVRDENTIPPDGDVQFSVTSASINSLAVRNVLNAEVEPVAYSYAPRVEELPVVRESCRVTLNDDGSLSGRVVPLMWLESAVHFNLTGNAVYLFDAGGPIAQTSVAADGSFRFESIQPGSYDFASNGPHGAAAFSIDVVPSATVASTSKLSVFPVSTAVQDSGDGFGVVLGEPVSGPMIVDIVVETQAPPVNSGYPAGGGFGGGGGGYGGFGDLGSWLGAALGIWAIAEAIDNDNDNNRQPVIVPPVVIPPATSPF